MVRQGHNRTSVIAAALALVDRDGLDALTMRALASDLSIEAPSLYEHVTNKSDVLDGIAELIYDEIDVPPSSDPWQERVRMYCHELRRVLLAHPNTAPIMAIRPVIGARTLRLTDDVLGELVDIGFDHGAALFTLDTLVSYVMGHVLTELSANPALSGHDPEALAAARSALPADVYPHLARTLALEPPDRDAEFGFGVRVLVAGISAELAKRQNPLA